jgi:YVTN family beta-propeller protein
VSAGNAARGQTAFVGALGPAVTRFNLQTDSVIGTTGLQARPGQVVALRDGSRAYLAIPTAGVIEVIDGMTGAVITQIQLPDQPAFVQGIALAPDGRTVYAGVAGTGSVAPYAVAISTATNQMLQQVDLPSTPLQIAVSPDGTRLYAATEVGISVLSAQPLAVVGTMPVGNGEPGGLAISPDGATLYETQVGGNTVRVVDLAGNAAPSSVPVGTSPFGIVVTPDGRKAYVANYVDQTLSVIDTLAGSVIHTIPIAAGDFALAVTPDGSRLFMTGPGTASTIPPVIGTTVSVLDTASDTVIDTVSVDYGVDYIALGAPGGLVASVLPSGRSVQTGSIATLFATLLNSSAVAAQNCRIALPASAPGSLTMSYQATDPNTNAPVGSPDTPVSLAANGGSQSFLLSFSAGQEVAVSEQTLQFACLGLQQPAAIPGVNTVDLRFSSQPTPDIVALAATPSGNGIVTIPESSHGAAAFAVATVNLGAAGAVTVGTDAATPLAATLCQTNPATAACLAPPATSVAVDVTAGATPTFSVFLSATAPIGLDPAANRLAVTFIDDSGDLLARTSVAVDTD